MLQFRRVDFSALGSHNFLAQVWNPVDNLVALYPAWLNHVWGVTEKQRLWPSVKDYASQHFS